jgi:hypothetical protein
MQSGSGPWIPDKQILEICHCRHETILLTPNSSCEAYWKRQNPEMKVAWEAGEDAWAAYLAMVHEEIHGKPPEAEPAILRAASAPASPKQSTAEQIDDDMPF